MAFEKDFQVLWTIKCEAVFDDKRISIQRKESICEPSSDMNELYEKCQSPLGGVIIHD